MTEAELRKLLEQGKLEQTCPDCGRKEAAGSYCTRCLRPMNLQDFCRPKRTAAQDAAFKASRANRLKKSAPRAIPEGTAA